MNRTDATIDEHSGEIQRFISRPQFSIRHTRCAASEFEPHSHSSFTATAILAGRLQARIGAESFDLSPGQVALTNANQIHSASASSVEFVSVAINPIFISEMVIETGLARASAEITFRANVARDEAIIGLSRQMKEEISALDPGHEAMLDAMARQMVIHLLRHHFTVRQSARIELSRAGPVDRRLRRAIEFMHDNYGRELALEEIASAAYLSEYHFARLFKQITGLTPHAYLANIRLERARKLLTETLLPINQVAAMVGYQSQSHFTKIFKATTGVTPGAFRESNER
ncbi:MAG: AraC family transcriptional regulator [Acidobacteriota bacterium]